MENPARPTTTTVTVFTRHTADCPKKADRYWKRRNCCKWIYKYVDGKDQSISAKTRSWAQAEKTAQVERDSHDPIQKRLSEIKAAEQLAAEKLSAEKAQDITVTAALSRWAASLKGRKEATSKVHATFQRKVESWTKRVGVRYLNEITPDPLVAEPM